MARAGLLDELNKLPLAERLAIVEAAIRSMREELQPSPRRGLRGMSREEKDRLLREGAAIMAPLYASDAELTAFTALDGEDFVEPEEYLGTR